MITTLLGLTGGLCLALCGFPQARLCIRQGHARGVSAGLLWLWAAGECFWLAYLLRAHPEDLIMLAQVVLCLGSILPVLWFRYRPRT